MSNRKREMDLGVFTIQMNDEEWMAEFGGAAGCRGTGPTRRAALEDLRLNLLAKASDVAELAKAARS